MRLRASEKYTSYYEFDKDLLNEYKTWVKDNDTIISKESFSEFVFNEFNISDFEVYSSYAEVLDFENFNEWINQ